MSPDLYYTPASPPCRAVMLAAEAIGVTLNYKIVDTSEGEHMTPEYEQVTSRVSSPSLHIRHIFKKKINNNGRNLKKKKKC